jgi:hypothetical protein
MRGMKFGPGKSWPRNPAPDPEVIRERLRSRARSHPIPPSSLGR